MVSLLKGYKCVLAVSSKASKDKINMMKSLGAKIYVCPSNVPPDDSRSYYQVAERLNREIQNSVYINQYFNELNKMEGKQETEDVKMIEISLDLLKNLRNLLEISNERIKWKLEELLPVGLIIQQLDEILKKHEEDK